MRFGLRRLLPWLLLMGTASSVSVGFTSAARAPVLRLGKLTVARQVSRPRLLASFRHEMRKQVAKLPLRGRKTSAVLSGTVLKLNTRRDGRVTKTTCVVSATLARRDNGALIAILKGKATAQDDGDVASTQHLALQAAVHSTLRNVPKVLP